MPDDVMLTGPQVRTRYGGISKMTLWRWRHDPDLGFPIAADINGRLFFRKDELEAFDKARRKEKAPAE